MEDDLNDPTFVALLGDVAKFSLKLRFGVSVSDRLAQELAKDLVREEAKKPRKKK